MPEIHKILSPKQLQFVINANAKWNFAHGSVRTGKTVCATFRFLQDCLDCVDSKIYIVGHTFDTAYRNIIRLILDSEELAIFRPFCSWSGKKLYFKDKTITVLGAKDEGAIGSFQGDTYSLVYCDEIVLYPQSIIEMIMSRLSKSYSRGFATTNPSYPDHIVKKWIDRAADGDPQFYALHFTLDDNPFVDESYKQMLRDSCSGLFYKRNYLGLWCMAEGAIFECFDKNVHVVNRPPRCADYWIVGVDYGASNPFGAVLVGVNTGLRQQIGKCLWVEKEFFWDHKTRQKTNSELAEDLIEFIGDYSIKGVYIDPSAASFRCELQKKGVHTISADNSVLDGISYTVSEMKKGNLFYLSCCKNLIRETQGYVWDDKKARRGEDEPLKKDDHLMDALRYAIYTHQVPTYKPYKNEADNQYLQNRFHQVPRRF
jgi:PBSX family phage terminase large subunit